MGKRGSGHTSRWGITTLNFAEKQYTVSETEGYLNRIVTRANKAAGYDTAKKPTVWNYELTCCEKDYSGTVEGFTKSEARSNVKKEVGIAKRKRLPTNLKLEKSNDGDQ